MTAESGLGDGGSREASFARHAVEVVPEVFITERESTVSDETNLDPSQAKDQVTPPEPKQESAAGEAQRQQPAAQRVALQIDDSKVNALYANFCRVTGTPEELIIDFGLNPQPIGVPSQPIVINERIVMNYYTAKRMLHALQLTLQRHEATFGVLETDIQKRVRMMPNQPRPQG